MVSLATIEVETRQIDWTQLSGCSFAESWRVLQEQVNLPAIHFPMIFND